MFTELSLLRPQRLKRANFLRADIATNNENALIKSALLDFCYELHEKGTIKSDDIKELMKNYQANHAVEWYQKGMFIFQCVNDALNSGNIERIYLLRRYITDLHEQIHASKHQFDHLEWDTTRIKTEIQPPKTTLYRCVQIFEQEIKTLQSLVGQLVSNKSFMSASKNKDIALKFASHISDIPLLLFEINVDLTSHGILDTQMNESGKYSQHEFLLDFGIRFRLTKCELDTKDNIWLCSLDMTDEEPAFLQQAPLLSLDKCLSQLNLYRNDATLLNNTIETNRSYSGKFCIIKSVFRETKRTLPLTSRPIEWAHVLQIKALIEWKQKYLLKLSNEWTRAIQIYANSDTKYFYDDLYMIYCLNNIGYIYHLFGKDYLAIQMIKTALNICNNQLLTKHLVFAQSCRTLGYVFANLGDFKSALNYHKRAVSVTRQLSPSAQWNTVLMLRNMGDICQRSRNFSQAHIYYKQAANTYKKFMDIFTAKDYLEMMS